MSEIMKEKEEVISLEELRAVLAQKGLDIRELAQEAKAMKNEANLERQITAPAKKATTNDPVFELALANYPDFVIRRSTSKTEKLLVIMPSQNSYYIKTVKNGVEIKDVLDRKSYGTFTSGMPEFELEDFWIDKVQPGLQFYDEVMTKLKKDAIRKAIVGRYYIKADDPCRWREEEMYKMIPNILKAFPGRDFYSEYQEVARFCDKFGLENTRDFIQAQDSSLAEDVIRDMVSELIGYDFKYSSFKDYVLYDAVRMGFAKSMYHFFYTWKDTLSMQMDIYGKIKEKYPVHLCELHQQLSYKKTLMQEEIDARKFARQIEKTAKFEATIGDYVFLAPKTTQDFYEEATNQANCLAGYVAKYTDGEDHILFMREKNDPETSLVTIELGLDGSLKQAYQARNTRVTEHQRNAINTWLAKVVYPAIAKEAA